MKHHTRCLAALGLYAVSLLCLTDCHPAPADPVDPPSLTHSWEVSSTDAYQDALSSASLPPEAELSLPETSPAATETVSSLPAISETSGRASSVASTSPEETSPIDSPSSTSSPDEKNPSVPAPAEPTPAGSTAAPAAPTAPTTSEPPATETTTEPSATETTTEPPTQAPAPSPTHDRSNGLLAFQRQNELLAQNNIPPLQWSEALYEIAAMRAAAISVDYSHVGCPDWVGENLLRGVISPDMAVQIWYDSDGHRQNMLAGWTYGAIANYGSCWTAIFAMTETP